MHRQIGDDAGQSMTEIRRTSIPTSPVPVDTSIAMLSTRVERAVGGVGVHATETGDAQVASADGGLPVNGLHAVFELRRRPEFPFPDYGPNNKCTSDRRRDYDDDCEGSFRDRG